MLELLAPAGSMEALRAAVQNGANAVYLGVGAFNARQSAKNFTPQTLVDAIKYCHIRGVQVHLTLNTLVSDRETGEVAALIRHAAASCVDAFILTIRYKEGQVSLLSGISMKSFTMNKNADILWDKVIRRFLQAKEIAFETL